MILRLIIALSILVLASCSCMHTKKLVGSTGYSLRTTSQWQRIPAPVIESTLESLALVDIDSKNMVVLYIFVKSDTNDVVDMLWDNMSKQKVSITDITLSTLIDDGLEFNVVDQNVYLKTIVVSNDEFTFVMQILCPNNTSLTDETQRLIRSFHLD